MTPADVTNPAASATNPDADAGNTAPRWSKNIVYKRKPKKPVAPVIHDTIPSPAALPNLTSSVPPPPTVATSPPPPPVMLPSPSKNKNQKLSINIRSLTRAERSQLLCKLNTELVQVRAMIRRAEEILGTVTEPKNLQHTVAECVNVEAIHDYTQAFRSCQLLLSKLMKHRNAPIFNSPVDVEGLGLHDYFSFISEPMDLGTVKMRLSKNQYTTPEEFARDIRLTFSNAMLYNGKGHQVHSFAQKLSEFFEERWVKIEADLQKRDMTSSEKERLKGRLEKLPKEVKRRVVLLMIRKTNPYVNPDDDVELDFDTMDAETLWQLHRYLNNYSKNSGKHKSDGISHPSE